MNEPIDLRLMPGFNPVITNGIDSVSKGLVVMGGNPSYRFCNWAVSNGYHYPGPMLKAPHPRCVRHGAMLRVSKDGIYRCGELGCDNGCYWP